MTEPSNWFGSSSSQNDDPSNCLKSCQHDPYMPLIWHNSDSKLI